MTATHDAPVCILASIIKLSQAGESTAVAFSSTLESRHDEQHV